MTDIVDDCCPASAEDTSDTKNDPFAYLNRGDFTSEKFKVELQGLPTHYSIPGLKKLLNEKLKLSCSKLKPLKDRRRSWAYICFKNEEDRLSAIKVLRGYSWKGRTLHAQIAKPAPDPLVKKRQTLANESQVQKFESIEEAVKASTIPLWNMPYEKQLEKKESEILNFIESIKILLLKINEDLNEHLDAFEFSGIKPSPVLQGYRNKCEFSVGWSSETKEITVGFRLGSYVTGSVEVAPIDNLVHVPERMKDAVKAFQEFVRSSDVNIFDVEIQSGHFKQLTCRWSSTTDQLMLIVGVNYRGLSDQQLDKLKCDVKVFFDSGPGKDVAPTSLYITNLEKRQSKDVSYVYELLSGERHIYEMLNGIKFQISPEAFFQVNTLAAEILYNTAIEYLSDNLKNASVIDVCCGIGTIGLCFADKCEQVYGIDSVKQAISDANDNAKVNNCSNCNFFHGFAENILLDTIDKSNNENIVCVIDPPRAGLHKSAIRQLRRAEKIKKFVYISCNIQSAKKDFIDFGRKMSKSMAGSPFVPKKFMAVDMFPFTNHCELIVLFERI